jgi:carbonic anhydrase
LLFDKNLGELFVVRDAGNIADKLALGSIEYAIEHLHAKVLVILGHESCGAVAASLSGEEMPTKNLQAIVDKISPAFENSKEV